MTIIIRRNNTGGGSGGVDLTSNYAWTGEHRISKTSTNAFWVRDGSSNELVKVDTQNNAIYCFDIDRQIDIAGGAARPRLETYSDLRLTSFKNTSGVSNRQTAVLEIDNREATNGNFAVKFYDPTVSGSGGVSPGNPRTYFDSIFGLATISYITVSGFYGGTGEGFKILGPFETAVNTGLRTYMFGVRSDVLGASVQITSNGNPENYPLLCGINDGGGSPTANFAIDRDGSLWWGNIVGTSNLVDAVETYRAKLPANMGMDMRLYRDSGAGALRMNTAFICDETISVSSSITANTNTSDVTLFGPALVAPAVTPSSLHGFVVRKQWITSGTTAAVIDAEFADASASSTALQGQTIFAHTATGTVGNLTATTNGGGLRNRRQIRQRGSGTISLCSNDSLNYTQDASTGTVTEYVGSNYEAPTIAATTTTYINERFRSSSVTGTSTNAYHSYYEALGHGTNRFEIWMDTDAGIFFRESGNEISSDSSGRVRHRAASIMLDSTNLGFYGTTPAAKPTITGSRGSNAALASLLTSLASLGLLTDSSS